MFLPLQYRWEQLLIFKCTTLCTLFSRTDFAFLSGIFAHVDSVKGAYVVVQASTIRYRRSLKLFDRYTIETRIVSFDER